MNTKKVVIGLLSVLTFFSYSYADVIHTQTMVELMAALPSPLPDRFDVFNVKGEGADVYEYEYHYEYCGTVAPAYYTTVSDRSVFDWQDALRKTNTPCVIIVADGCLSPHEISVIDQSEAEHVLPSTVHYFVTQNCTMAMLRRFLIPVRDARSESVIVGELVELSTAFPEETSAAEWPDERGRF